MTLYICHMFYIYICYIYIYTYIYIYIYIYIQKVRHDLVTEQHIYTCINTNGERGRIKNISFCAYSCLYF